MTQHLISIEKAKEDLLSCGVYLAENIKSRESRAAAMEAMVVRYVDKGDVDMAAALADSVDDPYVRDGLLVHVIGKCIDIGDDDYAFQLVEAIEEPRTKSTALESIALRKAAKGDFEKAIEVAEDLEHSSNAFAGFSTSRALAGDNLLAMQTLDRVEFYNSRVDALQEIAFNYLRQDEFEKAGEMLEHAASEADEIEFTEDKIRAMLEIGLNFIEAKQNDKAINIFGKAREIITDLEGVHKESLFVQVATGFLKAGSIDLADRALDLVFDKTQIAYCLVGFSQVFLAEDEREESLETIEEAYEVLRSQTETEIRDSRARFSLFAAIASQFAQLGKIERGIEIAHQNPEQQSKNQALTQIAQICTLQENDEMAKQTIKGIDEDSQRMMALVGVSDAKYTKDKSDEALEILDEAATLVDTVPQFIARSDIEQELAERFHAYGEVEKARRLVSDNIQTIREVPGDGNRSVALAGLSRLMDKFEFELSDENKDIISTLVRTSEW